APGLPVLLAWILNDHGCVVNQILWCCLSPVCILYLLFLNYLTGELSLVTASRTEVKHSQSSFSASKRVVLSGDDSAELIGLGLGLGAGLPLSATKHENSHRRHSHLDYSEEDNQPIRDELTGRETPESSDDIIKGSDGCGLGFVRSEVRGECVSQCDAQPDFCYNRGVCTIDTGRGAFCRCNAQDYMWIKGSRCDWVVTDFQVLCVVVGVASLTLVLHIIIVFFAKRLHRFRTENRRLRKRSLYRPQSEMQTDGFSVSMAPDSSHANDDGQKMEDPVKSPFTQGEEYLNIVNSHSPKYMNSPAHSSDHTPNANEEVNREDANSSPSNNLY
uniref:Neural chondroitin sulphate proteoglycan cytoplasmic domain-containing protein n=1 Tax=Hucho hucho TaxID=62062 RepID=A0A4W5K6E8_9TELE